MALIETWLKCELGSAVQVQYLNGNLFSQDNQANLIGVRVYENGEPASLSGSVSANVIRADGGTVAVAGTLQNGNECYVILPQAAYAVPGAVSVIIKITSSGQVTTLAAAVSTVYTSSTATAVDPGTIIPSIQSLISAIETAVASIPADYSSLWTSLAPAFSTSTAYTAGQYTTYDGKLWRFTTDHAAGSWNAAHAVQVNLGGDVSDLKSAFVDETLIANEELSIDSSNWELGGIGTGGAGNPPQKVANTIRIRNKVPVTTKGIVSLSWECDTGYTAKLCWLDKNGLKTGETTYKASNTVTFDDTDWSILFVLAHGDAEMLVSEASHISVTIGYNPRYENHGNISTLGYTSLSQCNKSGWYNFPSSYASTITDKPSDYPSSSGGCLLVMNKASNDSASIQLLFSTKPEISNRTYMRLITSNYTSVKEWSRVDSVTVNEDLVSLIASAMQWRGRTSVLGITTVSSLYNKDPGYYGDGAINFSAISGLPDDYTNEAGWFEVIKPLYNGSFIEVICHSISGNAWRIVYNQYGQITQDWQLIYGPMLDNRWDLLRNKKVAIIGDSISTNGTDGDIPNVPEIEVKSEDVGVELSAYLTYYDVQGGLSLGGHTFTSDEIGTEVTFTPVAEDVGKKIGVPNNYNPASRTVWWEIMMSQLGFTPIPVCWSGSSVTSHEGETSQYKTSYAWHDAQIRKCGIRTPGTMTRTEPDLIIVYRGTNDFSHSPYTLLTDNYFDNYNWEYPANDSVTGGYGYKEGLCLTIKKLRDAYPNAKIFLCTLNVFKRVNYSHFPTNNGINSLSQYNDAIREVADFMGCGVIDFDKDGITFENCYSQGYITDSSTIPTHPSDKGHKAMGLKAIADLKAQYSNMT